MPAPAWANTRQMRYGWYRPWRVPTSRFRARRFKRRLWAAGLLSPNFSIGEASSGDGERIPRKYRHAAQRQAFAMERVRHLCGDKPIRVLSWYRSPAHNAAVGGATRSQHLYARACDVASSAIRYVGVDTWNAACYRVFKRTGIGYDTNTGEVRHVDTRPWYARWFYS